MPPRRQRRKNRSISGPSERNLTASSRSRCAKPDDSPVLVAERTREVTKSPKIQLQRIDAISTPSCKDVFHEAQKPRSRPRQKQTARKSFTTRSVENHYVCESNKEDTAKEEVVQYASTYLAQSSKSIGGDDYLDDIAGEEDFEPDYEEDFHVKENPEEERNFHASYLDTEVNSSSKVQDNSNIDEPDVDDELKVNVPQRLSPVKQTTAPVKFIDIVCRPVVGVQSKYQAGEQADGRLSTDPERASQLKCVDEADNCDKIISNPPDIKLDPKPKEMDHLPVNSMKRKTSADQQVSRPARHRDRSNRSSLEKCSEDGNIVPRSREQSTSSIAITKKHVPEKTLTVTNPLWYEQLISGNMYSKRSTTNIMATTSNVCDDSTKKSAVSKTKIKRLSSTPRSTFDLRETKICGAMSDMSSNVLKEKMSDSKIRNQKSVGTEIPIKRENRKKFTKKSDTKIHPVHIHEVPYEQTKRETNQEHIPPCHEETHNRSLTPTQNYSEEIEENCGLVEDLEDILSSPKLRSSYVGDSFGTPTGSTLQRDRRPKSSRAVSNRKSSESDSVVKQDSNKLIARTDSILQNESPNTRRKKRLVRALSRKIAEGNLTKEANIQKRHGEDIALHDIVGCKREMLSYTEVIDSVVHLKEVVHRGTNTGLIHYKSDVIYEQIKVVDSISMCFRTIGLQTCNSGLTRHTNCRTPSARSNLRSVTNSHPPPDIAHEKSVQKQERLKPSSPGQSTPRSPIVFDATERFSDNCLYPRRRWKGNFDHQVSCESKDSTQVLLNSVTEKITRKRNVHISVSDKNIDASLVHSPIPTSMNTLNERLSSSVIARSGSLTNTSVCDKLRQGANVKSDLNQDTENISDQLISTKSDSIRTASQSFMEKFGKAMHDAQHKKETSVLYKQTNQLINSSTNALELEPPGYVTREFQMGDVKQRFETAHLDDNIHKDDVQETLREEDIFVTGVDEEYDDLFQDDQSGVVGPNEPDRHQVLSNDENHQSTSEWEDHKMYVENEHFDKQLVVSVDDYERQAFHGEGMSDENDFESSHTKDSYSNWNRQQNHDESNRHYPKHDSAQMSSVNHHTSRSRSRSVERRSPPRRVRTSVRRSRSPARSPRSPGRSSRSRSPAIRSRSPVRSSGKLGGSDERDNLGSISKDPDCENERTNDERMCSTRRDRDRTHMTIRGLIQKYTYLTPSELLCDQNAILPDTKNMIEKCGRNKKWEKLAGMLNQLMCVSDKHEVQRCLQHFASALMNGRDYETNFMLFLQHLIDKRNGELETNGKHCVGTIALMMMTQCLLLKKTKEAFMILYLMNSKDIHYVYPALPFVVHTPRVILTAAEICLAVEQPKQIFDVMRLAGWFEKNDDTKNLGMMLRIRVDSIRDLMLRLLRSVKSGTITEDVKSDILSLIIVCVKKLAINHKKDELLYRGYSRLLDFTVLFGELLKLAKENCHEHLYRAILRSAISIRKIEIPPREVRHMLHFFYNTSKRLSEFYEDACLAMKYGSGLGVYPHTKYDGKTGGIVILWQTMSREEMFVSMDCYLESVCISWLNLGVARAQSGLKLAVKLCENIRNRFTWLAYGPEMLENVSRKVAIDKAMSVFKTDMDPPLEWMEYSDGIFHISSTSLFKVLESKLMKKRAQDQITGTVDKFKDVSKFLAKKDGTKKLMDITSELEQSVTIGSGQVDTTSSFARKCQSFDSSTSSYSGMNQDRSTCVARSQNLSVSATHSAMDEDRFHVQPTSASLSNRIEHIFGLFSGGRTQSQTSDSLSTSNSGNMIGGQYQNVSDENIPNDRQVDLSKQILCGTQLIDQHQAVSGPQVPNNNSGVTCTSDQSEYRQDIRMIEVGYPENSRNQSIQSAGVTQQQEREQYPPQDIPGHLIKQDTSGQPFRNQAIKEASRSQTFQMSSIQLQDINTDSVVDPEYKSVTTRPSAGILGNKEDDFVRNQRFTPKHDDGEPSKVPIQMLSISHQTELMSSIPDRARPESLFPSGSQGILHQNGGPRPIAKPADTVRPPALLPTPPNPTLFNPIRTSSAGQVPIIPINPEHLDEHHPTPLLQGPQPIPHHLAEAGFRQNSFERDPLSSGGYYEHPTDRNYEVHLSELPQGNLPRPTGPGFGNTLEPYNPHVMPIMHGMPRGGDVGMYVDEHQMPPEHRMAQQPIHLDVAEPPLMDSYGWSHPGHGSARGDFRSNIRDSGRENYRGIHQRLGHQHVSEFPICEALMNEIHAVVRDRLIFHQEQGTLPNVDMGQQVVQSVDTFIMEEREKLLRNNVTSMNEVLFQRIHHFVDAAVDAGLHR